ncbi:MAG TPA: ABC transporter substrate-binding protein [Acidimicrobiales bacterium]|jgi:branched-chain amino acid transport system substrate-binding protein|nr:ABC transporter substrate-binding protein [Acidimicrobiales bacterium]
MRYRMWRALAAVTAGLLCSLVGSVPSAPGGAAPAPITIALVTSLTGPAGSESIGDPATFEARIDLQNAEGGVDGHKLVAMVIDDQTSPTGVQTAVNDAVAKGALGIVAVSPVFFLGAKSAQQAGVPVTGSYSDGPEWGEQPYTNMFAADLGSENPKDPVNTLEGTILKHFGATVLGTYAYSISPSSTDGAIESADSFERAGGRSPVVDTSLPYGTEDFSSAALTAKQDGINAIFPAMQDSSNFALAQALEQAGVKLKAAVYLSGLGPSVVHSPAWTWLQGGYFGSIFRPFQLPNAGTRQMQAALERYAHWSSTQFPTLYQYESWAGADLMIKGLQLAGPHPTHAGVITALRGIKAYDANGVLPNPLDFATTFGHDPPKQCIWILRAATNGFVPTQAQPFCGTDLPGTAVASSS